MNPQNHTEQEYLALLDMNGLEQRKWLADIGVFSHDCCLADLAERLWKKAVTEYMDLREAMDTVFDKTNVLGGFLDFWIYNAKPIHRIVAALIALRRAGVTEI